MMISTHHLIRLAVLGCSAMTLSACGFLSGSSAPNSVEVLDQSKLAISDRSPCGNTPSYQNAGRSYRVLPSAKGYREDGIARMYGQGKSGWETAGCEQFDSGAYTAAHRTLPLPSYVRVSNPQTGKSVIVRVNDRGPFNHNGIIDLSSAAANSIGLVQNAAMRVRVEGLDENRRLAAPAPAPKVSQPRTQAQHSAVQQAKTQGHSYYVLAGNFPQQADALELFIRLTSVGLGKTELASSQAQGRIVHQVRIGPLYTQDQIDRVKDTLENNGMATFKVVPIKN